MQDFKQELTENSYIRQEEVAFGQCDRAERMRISALLDKVASFGGYDYDARGITRQVLIGMGYAFLLSRVAIRIHALPCYGDILTTQTWENGAKGAHMQRVFEMTDQTGRLCVSAKSDWILVDPVSHKIQRPRGFTEHSLTGCPREIHCPAPGKIVLPKEGLEELGVRRVMWSDLDGNGHLYSGKYGDIVWDHLPAQWQEETPLEFHINYSKEATLGEELRLAGICGEDGYRMEGMGSGGVCFTARIVF
ncbi:MAG: acyl carrier protein [Ruminococcaceae bacterium]|nr:acyl carrier protein [Oscillospiraceae bacterium]